MTHFVIIRISIVDSTMEAVRLIIHFLPCRYSWHFQFIWRRSAGQKERAVQQAQGSPQTPRPLFQLATTKHQNWRRKIFRPWWSRGQHKERHEWHVCAGAQKTWWFRIPSWRDKTRWRDKIPDRAQNCSRRRQTERRRRNGVKSRQRLIQDNHCPFLPGATFSEVSFPLETDDCANIKDRCIFSVSPTPWHRIIQLKVVKSVSDDNFQRLMDKANSVNARIEELMKKKEEVRAKLEAAMSQGGSTSSTSTHSTSTSGGGQAPAEEQKDPGN